MAVFPHRLWSCIHFTSWVSYYIHSGQQPALNLYAFSVHVNAATLILMMWGTELYTAAAEQFTASSTWTAGKANVTFLTQFCACVCVCVGFDSTAENYITPGHITFRYIGIKAPIIYSYNILSPVGICICNQQLFR